jgi:HEAT repeat protein
MRIFYRSKSFLVAMATGVLIAGTASMTLAGRGGSDARIRNAVNTGSVDAIIAEIERAERLICGGCIGTVMKLLDDARYEVREVAAWWFARRPAQKNEITERSLAHLAGSDSILARNAADILGAFEDPGAIAALSTAVQRQDLSAEARAHAAQALGAIGHTAANPALEAAMQDDDADVRLAAVSAWLAVRYQGEATPVLALIADPDARVRRKAAAVAGSLREPGARAALEAQLAGDADPAVRRNAAWALGRIGDAASRAVLTSAVEDPSPLVRMTAKVALRTLR